MTSTIRTDRPSHADGFTLIELLVVISIMGLLAALAVTSLRPSRGFDQRRHLEQLQERMRAARAQAVLDGRIVDVEQAALPAGYLAKSPLGPVLRWFPDGSALPGEIRVDGRTILILDPVTGLAGRER